MLIPAAFAVFQLALQRAVRLYLYYGTFIEFNISFTAPINC